LTSTATRARHRFRCWTTTGICCRVSESDRTTCCPAAEVIALVGQLPGQRSLTKYRNSTLRGTARVLDWLASQPGEGWQARWLAADADRDMSWMDALTVPGRAPTSWIRNETVAGFACLLVARVVLPSFNFLTRYRSKGLFDRVRVVICPDLFAQLEQEANRRGISDHHRSEALIAVCKLVLHTGSDVDQLTPDDLLEMFAWATQASSTPQRSRGLAHAWELLSIVGVTPAGSTLRHALLRGQRPTADLVNDYGVQSEAIREVFIRYLDERRPSLDYSSLRGLTAELVGRFWVDIEHHHPGIDTLHLSEDVAAAWRERVSTVTDSDGVSRPRRELLSIYTCVRAFYFDIQQWALTDPSWVHWAVPSPVRRSHTRGFDKLNRQRQAEVHQRIRERLPTLPLLLETAERNRDDSEAMLKAASAQEPGAVFDHAGARYRRTAWRPTRSSAACRCTSQRDWSDTPPSKPRRPTLRYSKTI